MQDYRLDIKFNEEDLKNIYKADQKIILVKHTKEQTNSNVAWVCFKPFVNNTINWSMNFALYASNTELQHGATIHKLSDVPATTKVMYNFEQGVFQNPQPVPRIGAHTFALQNKMDGYNGLTFGLAQDVQVNGVGIEKNPINAVFVPLGQSVSITPVEKIDIYLKNGLEDSTVITKAAAVPLTVVYQENEKEHTIAYDNRCGFHQIRP